MGRNDRLPEYLTVDYFKEGDRYKVRHPSIGYLGAGDCPEEALQDAANEYRRRSGNLGVQDHDGNEYEGE